MGAKRGTAEPSEGGMRRRRKLDGWMDEGVGNWMMSRRGRKGRRRRRRRRRRRGERREEDAGRCLFKTRTQHHRMVGN